MAVTSSFLGGVTAVQNGEQKMKAIDANLSVPSDDQRVAALKHELAGYVASGNMERAAQVRRQLAGASGDETAQAEPVEQATPRTRKTK